MPEEIEQIMVVPTMLFHEVGFFQGFCSEPERYLKTLLDPAHTSYEPRPAMEEDPSYKQLIPYCIFQCEGKVFHYRRGYRSGRGSSAQQAVDWNRRTHFLCR